MKTIKPNEAKQALEDLKTGKQGGYPLTIAQIAIDKFIPLKPENIRTVQDIRIVIGDCPECKGTVVQDYKHCCQCARALDWEL